MKAMKWLLVAALVVGCDDGGSTGADDGGAGDGGAGGAGAAGGAGGGGAGGGAGGDGGAGGGGPPCIPAPPGLPAALETITTYCGDCHGETPQFGAPQSLIGEADLRGELERVVARITQGTMPPAGQPMIPEAEAAAFLAWATCGDVVGPPPNPGGFEVTREIFPDPGARPENTEIMDWRATNGGIAPDEVDNYRCWAFGGTDSDRFIRRMEPIIDDARVLHHMVVYAVGRGADDGSEVGCGNGVGNIIYAWAPGQQALSFPEGGLRTGPDRRYVLEIHYNNTAGLEGVVDQSGLRVYHGPPEGTEVGMLSLGPEGFVIPANAQTRVAGQCNVQQEHRVIAAFPHMHEVGYALTSTLYRDGSDDAEDFISLTGWDFDAQFFYSIPVTIGPGDRIITECTFRNMTDSTLFYGPRTQDEMCYNFVYVTPPPANGQCNAPVQNPNPNPGNGEYMPGPCAAEDAADLDPGSIRGPFVQGETPASTGGDAAPGGYVLSAASIYMPSYELPIATIDPDETYLDLRGTLVLGDDLSLHVDVEGISHIVAQNDLSLDRDVVISFSGQVTAADGPTASILGDCGNEGAYELPYTAANGVLTIELPVGELNGSLQLSFTAP